MTYRLWQVHRFSAALPAKRALYWRISRYRRISPNARRISLLL